MIGHVFIPVRDLTAASAFYEAALAPPGLAKLVVREMTVGFGKKYSEFWLNLRAGIVVVDDPGNHICLRAPSEAAVCDFHAAALAHGGRDGGAPRKRQGSVASYFSAFIIDPDGNKTEAVIFPKGGEA